MREQEQDPFIGTSLPGGHNILELIEVGGMGRVYRAEQAMLGRTVAVKVIHPHLLGNASAEARFVTEARAASKLNHPNSVSVIDFGKVDGRFYLVMEHLRGRDLAHVLHQEWPLTIERIADILSQTLAALAEAHHLGIVHRDLKPENIVLEKLLSGGQFVKVLDFGLVKLRGGSNQRSITAPDAVCGTLEYMAPEQVRGDPVDGRADLYSCGVLLYQMLTGRLPFESEDDKKLAMMQLSQLPTDPRVLLPSRHIPSGLADVAMRALVKDPSERYQCAQEMAHALAGFGVAKRDTLNEVEFRDCEHCAAPVPRKQRFCGDCGKPMSRRRTAPPALDEPRSRRWRVSNHALPLLEREEQMERLLELRAHVGDGFRAVQLFGEAGCGKTRLLHALMREAERLGDCIVAVTPDPWRAGVVYHALRSAIAQLLDCSEACSGDDFLAAPPDARAGLKIVFGAAQATSFRGRADAQDVLMSNQSILAAEAFRWALDEANVSNGNAQILFTIDDINWLDGASRSVFLDVFREEPWVRALLVVTSRRPSLLLPGCGLLELKGLSTAMAACIVQNKGLCPSDEQLAAARARSSGAQVAPLYVEHLLQFQNEGGGEPPAKLADLIAVRIDRLEQQTRQVLQAIAVAGNAAQTSQLIGLLPDASDLSRSLTALKKGNMVVFVGREHSLAHDLLREVVLATTPRAVRRSLHGLARRDFGMDQMELPLAAQAQHAFHAASSFEALALLDQLANQCIAHEDREGAIDAYRGAVELARRELSQGELDDPSKAVGVFSSKLAAELAAGGELGEARGVLQEAIHASDPSGSDRYRLLLQLAELAELDGRPDSVRPWLDDALASEGQVAEQGLKDELTAIRARLLKSGNP